MLPGIFIFCLFSPPSTPINNCATGGGGIPRRESDERKQKISREVWSFWPRPKRQSQAQSSQKTVVRAGVSILLWGGELKGQVLYSYGPRFIMQQPHLSQLPQESAGDEMQRANVSRLIEPNHDDGDGGGGGGCFLGFLLLFSLWELAVAYLSLFTRHCFDRLVCAIFFRYVQVDDDQSDDFSHFPRCCCSLLSTYLLRRVGGAEQVAHTLDNLRVRYARSRRKGGKPPH